MSPPIFPPAASSLAPQTDHLYFFLLGLSIFIIGLVFGPLLFFLFKYRRGNRASRAKQNFSTNAIEITWTVIPTLIAIGIFGAGARIFFQEEVAPGDTLEMNVVGKQWMWKIQHQEGNREINELHVPIGRAIKLTLGSEDVIHSFYIPAFRIKQDVVPGRFSTEWFEPTETGVFRFYCSEYCGMDHAKMQGLVYVMTADDYAAWLKRGRPLDTLSQSGEILYRNLGCSGCHDGHTSVHAPSLQGLYGSQVSLNDGTTVPANEKYLRDSILSPNAQIVAGYQPIMPTYQGHIQEEQLMQLISYIKSLSANQPSKAP